MTCGGDVSQRGPHGIREIVGWKLKHIDTRAQKTGRIGRGHEQRLTTHALKHDTPRRLTVSGADDEGRGGEQVPIAEKGQCVIYLKSVTARIFPRAGYMLQAQTAGTVFSQDDNPTLGELPER